MNFFGISNRKWVTHFCTVPGRGKGKHFPIPAKALVLQVPVTDPAPCTVCVSYCQWYFQALQVVLVSNWGANKAKHLIWASGRSTIVQSIEFMAAASQKMTFSAKLIYIFNFLRLALILVNRTRLSAYPNMRDLLALRNLARKLVCYRIDFYCGVSINYKIVSIFEMFDWPIENRIQTIRKLRTSNANEDFADYPNCSIKSGKQKLLHFVMRRKKSQC